MREIQCVWWAVLLPAFSISSRDAFTCKISQSNSMYNTQAHTCLVYSILWLSFFAWFISQIPFYWLMRWQLYMCTSILKNLIHQMLLLSFHYSMYCYYWMTMMHTAYRLRVWSFIPFVEMYSHFFIGKLIFFLFDEKGHRIRRISFHFTLIDSFDLVLRKYSDIAI